MRKLILLAAVGVLAACSKPTDTVIPADMAAWDKDLSPVVQKLSEEDRKLLAAYLVRAKLGEVFGGKGVPPATTVGAAIADQRQFLARKAQEEAEAKALAEKVQKERAAAMDQMRQAITVALVSKSIEIERGGSGMELDRHLVVKFAYKNNSGKDVAGVKGTVVVKDLFGDKLSAFGISNDDSIKAGQTAIWTGQRSIKYAIGSANKDEKLAGLGTDKFTVEWDPETIVFADGTKLVAP